MGAAQKRRRSQVLSVDIHGTQKLRSRGIVLKTTISTLTGGIALAMAFGVSSGAAASPWLYGPMIIGQANAAPANAAEQCSQLLQRARQAMSENDLDAAQRLLDQAESLNVKPNPLNPFADTTAKVRRDLDRKRDAAANPTLPSQRFSPAALLGGAERTTPADPFTGRTAEDVARQLNDRKGQAVSYLQRGRAELQKNNLPAATHWCHQAAQLGVSFGPNEDSPARLADEIRARGGSITPPPADTQHASQMNPPDHAPAVPVRSLPKPPSRTDSAMTPPQEDQVRLPGALDGLRRAAPNAADSQARAQSDHLLLQSRLALAVGDIRRAQQFSDQAQRLGITYQANEDSPARVRALIDKVQHITEQPEERKRSEAYRRQYARVLM